MNKIKVSEVTGLSASGFAGKICFGTGWISLDRIGGTEKIRETGNVQLCLF